MSKPRLEADQQLQQAIDVLPDHQPKRDLWRGIEDNITNHAAPATSSNGLYAIAASICIFAILGYMSVLQLTGSAIIQPQQPNANVLATLNHDHQIQKQALLVQFADANAVTDNWQEQLNELDRAADAVKAALLNAPNNPALLQLLQSIYQQQIKLIETVHVPKWQRV